MTNKNEAHPWRKPMMDAAQDLLNDLANPPEGDVASVLWLGRIGREAETIERLHGGSGHALRETAEAMSDEFKRPHVVVFLFGTTLTWKGKPNESLVAALRRCADEQEAQQEENLVALGLRDDE